MAVVERATISGVALAGLLRECVVGQDVQEGFLVGDVTREVTNHVSDSRQDNSVTEEFVNVVSCLPAPGAGLFYGPSGRIDRRAVEEMVAGAAPSVVGWYRYRRDDALRPTLRDGVVTRGLGALFGRRPFLCCGVTGRRSSRGSTHAYAYRFFRAGADGSLEPLEDATRNLGERTAGYRRGPPRARDGPFDLAVRAAAAGGPRAVREAVDGALEEAAREAEAQEGGIRAITQEIDRMLRTLAARHRDAARDTSAAADAQERRRREEETAGPIAAAVAAAPPPSPAEPFDFVAELMRNNLERRPSGP